MDEMKILVKDFLANLSQSKEEILLRTATTAKTAEMREEALRLFVNELQKNLYFVEETP